VFVQPILESEAESLRLHFVVERAGQAWGVLIKDEAGRVAWSAWDGAVQGDDFWSDEIQGRRLSVELHSARLANPLRLRIDKIAVIRPGGTPESIDGRNQLRSIIGQDDWIVDLGASVARLRFVGDDGWNYVCTAFLVSSDLMLTNQHCIATQAEAQSALVDFDFNEDGRIGRTVRLSQLLDTDYALDYSVVRLSEPVDRGPLRLGLTHPAEKERLLIIQHPAGEPKQVSIDDCTVGWPLVAGRGSEKTDFGHHCDTMGGSSGSPVLQFGSRRVVGLHHLGTTPFSSELSNRATHVDLILNHMAEAVRHQIEAESQAMPPTTGQEQTHTQQ
jgi:hypothetical protein